MNPLAAPGMWTAHLSWSNFKRKLQSSTLQSGNMTLQPLACICCLQAFCLLCRNVESPVWKWQQSVRASQPVVARPDLLPRAKDATARIHLHGWWGQESGPRLHTVKRHFFHISLQNQSLFYAAYCRTFYLLLKQLNCYAHGVNMLSLLFSSHAGAEAGKTAKDMEFTEAEKHLQTYVSLVILEVFHKCNAYKKEEEEVMLKDTKRLLNLIMNELPKDIVPHIEFNKMAKSVHKRLVRVLGKKVKSKIRQQSPEEESSIIASFQMKLVKHSGKPRRFFRCTRFSIVCMGFVIGIIIIVAFLYLLTPFL